MNNEMALLDREDKAEARDWMLDACRENIRELNFESQQVKEMWDEVSSENLRSTGRRPGIIFDAK